jgi:hypothetical protein
MPEVGCQISLIIAGHVMSAQSAPPPYVAGQSKEAFMARSMRTVWVGTLVLTAFWLLAAPDILDAKGIFAWRHFLTQYSGVLAIAAMSAAMILAIRRGGPKPDLAVSTRCIGCTSGWELEASSQP